MSIFAGMAAMLSASPITYTASGTFSGTTSSSTVSGPNQTWSFQVTIDSNPVPNFVFAASFMIDPLVGLTYVLDGSPVAIAEASVKFFNSSFAGGMELTLGTGTDSLRFSTAGAQMYSGAESAPTMLTGTYPSNAVLLFLNGDPPISQPQIVVEATAAGVPEPSAMVSCGAGLLALLCWRSFRRRSQFCQPILYPRRRRR